MCKKLSILTSFILMFGFVDSTIADHPQGILFEWWFDIGGTAVSDLTGSPDYPDDPNDGDVLDKFDGPVDWKDNYGTRARGWLHPTDDGDYTFWISSDENSELYLSTDDDPTNAALIAEVPGWTSYTQWDAYPEQQSLPITLAAGGKYYIEAVMKEGGGGDSMTVGWTGPGIGDEITIIDGAYLSPGYLSLGLQKAKNPVPADGAVDADVALLEWEAGFLAISHVVYLDEALLAETDMTLIAVDLDPGTTYTWRVDEVQEDGTVIEGNVWSFSTLPLEAHFPIPTDGAQDIVPPTTLSWTPGKNTIINDVYLGTDVALVEARDMSTFKGKLISPSYDAGNLELFTTYYWAVDEFTPTGTVAGPVWSFSTAEYVLIEDEERILNYDNNHDPFVSELYWDVPSDLTAGGKVSDLTLIFKGAPPPPPPEGSYTVDEATGTYTIVGSGADVWGSSDQFHYVYMNLTGDGEISARVVCNGIGSNSWAKGGVMIRESSNPDSKHMIMALTGGEGEGIAFQGRQETGGGSASYHGDVTALPPYWVRLVREGNNLTGYASADGVEWTLFEDTSPDTGGFPITNPQPVEMVDPVLIGLFVTSHAAGEPRAFVFDNVNISGDVDGVIVSEDIGIISVGNTPEPIYVRLEDGTGAVAWMVHPNPAATQIDEWEQWMIPLSEFANQGVDATASTMFVFGVGNGEPGGTGTVRIDDIMVIKREPEPGQLMENLAQYVIDLDIQGGFSNSLDAKLDTALKAVSDLNANNDVAAINSLEAFINAVEAQRGKKIPNAIADGLIEMAQEIIDLLTNG